MSSWILWYWESILYYSIWQINTSNFFFFKKKERIYTLKLHRFTLLTHSQFTKTVSFHSFNSFPFHKNSVVSLYQIRSCLIPLQWSFFHSYQITVDQHHSFSLRFHEDRLTMRELGFSFCWSKEERWNAWAEIAEETSSSVLDLLWNRRKEIWVLRFSICWREDKNSHTFVGFQIVVIW